MLIHNHNLSIYRIYYTVYVTVEPFYEIILYYFKMFTGN